MLTGVVEVGLFCHMAKAAYFGEFVRSLPRFLFVPCPCSVDAPYAGRFGDGSTRRWKNRNLRLTFAIRWQDD